MKALVVYDSVFGNTERIAQAIGDALGGLGAARTLPVAQLQPADLEGVTLLVVGSPTRGFRPTEGIAGFLKGLPAGALQGVRVAAFDTRFGIAEQRSFWMRLLLRVGNYAANPIAKQLQQSGGRMVAPPEGFIVNDTEGPLKEGELERAAAWARQVAAAG